MRALLPLLLCLAATPAVAQDAQPATPTTPPLSDPELAKETGKFLLPNGVELALSITSDTVLNGQLVLRTVFTIDHSVQTQVFGRDPTATPQAYAMSPGSAESIAPTGLTVTLDRQSGLQTITPTFGVTAGAPSVTIGGGATQDPHALGLTALPVTLGGPGVATPDGVVTVAALPNGTQVTLTGDQFAVSDLVGHAIATALANSGNDRTFDTTTNVAIDLRNIAPYQIGAAQMRVDSLALDAARGVGR